jgi:hypothetical protein
MISVNEGWAEQNTDFGVVAPRRLYLWGIDQTLAGWLSRQLPLNMSLLIRRLYNSKTRDNLCFNIVVSLYVWWSW